MSDTPARGKRLAEVLDPTQVTGVLPERRIGGVTLDTRVAAAGDLYLACRGTVTHGLDHVPAALERKVAVIAAEPGEIDRFDGLRALIAAAGASLVEVADLKAQSGAIAARFHDTPSEALTVVAVTGTDGKTSVCRFIQAALGALGVRCGYIGTLGWGIEEPLVSTSLTTPDGVSLQAMLAVMRDQGAAHVALEASSHGIAEGRLDAVTIDVAVLTNFGRDHLDYHGSLAAYRAAKTQLFHWQGLSAMVANRADELGRDLLEKAPPHLCRVAFDSCGSQPIASVDVLLEAREIRSIETGLQFTLHDSGVDSTVRSTLFGRFNVDNLLATAGVLRALGHAANDASRSLRHLAPVPGRMERFTASGRPAVIVDYAHTPQALSSAIEAVRAHCRARLWLVFGCGGDRDPGKRALMARAAQAADHIIVTDDNPRTEAADRIREAIAAGLDTEARARTRIIAGRERAIRHALTRAAPDDLVLVAGKGHEDYQIIGTTRYPFSDRRVVDRLLREAC